MWAGIGLSTMAFSTDNRAIDFGFVAGNTVLALISLGGAVALLKVTRISFIAWIFVWMLLSSSLIFSNASICMLPFVFFLPFKASVKSSIALTIMSAWVKVGCVMYLCLKITVSDIRSLLVFFT